MPGRAGEAGSKQDLQSVMTHEFGHATGWGAHYDGPNHIPRGTARCGRTDSNRETMCASNTSGVPWGRTLGPHDKHTFRRAYGP